MAMSATFCRRDLIFGFGFESVVVEERVCGRFGPISFLFFLFGSAIYVLISLLFCLVFFLFGCTAFSSLRLVGRRTSWDSPARGSKSSRVETDVHNTQHADRQEGRMLLPPVALRSGQCSEIVNMRCW